MTQHGYHPSPGNRGSQRSALLDRLHALHATRQQYLDQNLAPDVDTELLQQLVRRQLDPNDARLVYELIHAFGSWDAVHTTIIADEFKRRSR